MPGLVATSTQPSTSRAANTASGSCAGPSIGSPVSTSNTLPSLAHSIVARAVVELALGERTPLRRALVGERVQVGLVVGDGDPARRRVERARLAFGDLTQ